MNMDEVLKNQDLALILLGSLPSEHELLETTLPIVEEVETQDFTVEDVVLKDYVSSGEDVEHCNDDDDDDDDADADEYFLVDEENEIVEPEGEDVDVINADSFYSDPGNDDETNEYRRKRLIQSGSYTKWEWSLESITTIHQEEIKVLPPRTAEEIVARERERKARTTLLMALPEDHLAKFHKMTDAKEMWDAIKSRFGGNDESKKMQKYILKQQFKGFSVSNTEGLHKGYDRFQSLLSQLEIHGAGVSTEDANQKFLRSLPSACL
ncbi:hypothetical protein Tco_0945990 [Tanacetum coccineum]